MSSENGAEQQQKPQYVISQNTGLAFHPDDIIASCRKLQESLQRMQEDSERAIQKWDGEIQERDLAEKRRVAPGWLDVGESGRGLVPERLGTAEPSQVEQPGPATQQDSHMSDAPDQGAELDRAFGSLSVR
jgi:hypothetical protein